MLGSKVIFPADYDWPHCGNISEVMSGCYCHLMVCNLKLKSQWRQHLVLTLPDPMPCVSLALLLWRLNQVRLLVPALLTSCAIMGDLLPHVLQEPGLYELEWPLISSPTLSSRRPILVYPLLNPAVIWIPVTLSQAQPPSPPPASFPLPYLLILSWILHSGRRIGLHLFSLPHNVVGDGRKAASGK